MSARFEFPTFHDYPPYYTVQTVDVTREKQCSSWGSLILNYCKHCKVLLWEIFNLRVDDAEASELFSKPSIDRIPARECIPQKRGLFTGKLSPEAKRVFFDWLVQRGHGAWRDVDRTQFLVLWKTIPQWADTLMEWVQTFGLEDSVLTVHEISHGEETAGTELEGLDREIVIRAVAVLESKGRAKLFRGTSQDDEGIKFFARAE